MLNETCVNPECMQPLMQDPATDLCLCVSCNRRVELGSDGAKWFVDDPSAGAEEHKSNGRSHVVPRTPMSTPVVSRASSSHQLASRGGLNSAELAQALNRAAAEQGGSSRASAGPPATVATRSSAAAVPPAPAPSPAVSRANSQPASAANSAANSRATSPDTIPAGSSAQLIGATRVLAAPADWYNMTSEQLAQFAKQQAGGANNQQSARPAVQRSAARATPSGGAGANAGAGAAARPSVKTTGGIAFSRRDTKPPAGPQSPAAKPRSPVHARVMRRIGATSPTSAASDSDADRMTPASVPVEAPPTAPAKASRGAAATLPPARIELPTVSGAPTRDAYGVLMARAEAALYKVRHTSCCMRACMRACS